ncbi:MAG: PAS domain S-box protein, partial [Usitatibacter sp.]
MAEHSQTLLERRVLILAPTGRDASMTRAVFAEHGIRCAVCNDLPHLVKEAAAGAGAILISEEALPTQEKLYYLGERLSRQPTWSDLPVLLLAHPGADSTAVRQTVRALGNVTLLERPVRVAALMTAVQTALRARQRQYNAREHLTELDATAKALRDSEMRLKAIFDNAAVGIAELDADGRFALVNDSLCRLVGRERESLLSASMVDVTHGEDRPELETLMRRLFAGGIENFVTERRFVGSDGAFIWVKLTLSLARITDTHGARAVAVI